MNFSKNLPDSRQVIEIRNQIVRDHYVTMEFLEHYVQDDEDRLMRDAAMKQLNTYGLTVGHNCYAEKFLREVVSDFRHHLFKKYNVSCDH